MTLKQHKKSGLWFPKNTGSETAISEAYMLFDYGGLPCLVDFKDKVVMDCGAHIGAFSARAIEEGAAFCHCYEPMQVSAECIDKNLPADKHETVMAAVCSEAGEKEFHTRPSKLISGSLIHKGANHARWGYETLTIQGVSFHEELERIRPQILKMDVEGSEWELLDRPLPEFVETVLIEVHQLYSKGVDAAYELIDRVFPNSRHISTKECMAFKSKGRVTELTAVYQR